MLFVITGASGSGKSEYAEQLAGRLAVRERIQRKLYVATMETESDAARERIARHRALRAGKGFVTVESVMGLGKEALRDSLPGTVVLLECVSNLLANLMFSAGMTAMEAQREILSQVQEACGICRHLVVVTNEVFSETVGDSGALDQYVRALGGINCYLAGLADAFCEVVYSIPVFLKGEKLCRF